MLQHEHGITEMTLQIEEDECVVHQHTQSLIMHMSIIKMITRILMMNHISTNADVI